MMGQQQIPFFNSKNKYVNPVISVDGIFRLPTKFVLRQCQTKRLMVFNRHNDTCMEIVPFDTLEQDDDWMVFKYIHNTSNMDMLPIWDCNLLRRFHWSWYEKMYEGLHSNWFISLNKQLNVEERKTKTIYPKKELVYEAFDSSYGRVKIVIVGQSPYPTDHANGIGFSTNRDEVPVSLKMLKNATSDNVPNNLQTWVDQGVLLLNSSLTISSTKQEYFDEWNPFLRMVISTLSTKENLVWILMGKKAQSLKKWISKNHQIIETEHPAAASYEKREWDFKDCFNKCNICLEQNQIVSINWNKNN